MLAAAAALAVAGCGGSGAKLYPLARGPVCTAQARAALARFLRIRPGTIATAASTGNDGMPQCSFTARKGSRQAVVVLANGGKVPSAYFVLERTIEEASQYWAGPRPEPAPVAVDNLGLGASWFPQEQWLQATDGRELITTSVTWHGAGHSRRLALIEAVTRTYLHTPHGKAAQALAQGYP